MLYSQQIPWLPISCGQTWGKPYSKNLGDRTQLPCSDFIASIPLKILSLGRLSQYLLGHSKTTSRNSPGWYWAFSKSKRLQAETKTAKIKNQWLLSSFNGSNSEFILLPSYEKLSSPGGVMGLPRKEENEAKEPLLSTPPSATMLGAHPFSYPFSLRASRPLLQQN